MAAEDGEADQIDLKTGKTESESISVQKQETKQESKQGTNEHHIETNTTTDEDDSIRHVSGVSMNTPRSPKSKTFGSHSPYLQPTESHIQTYKLFQAAKEHREDLDLNKKQLRNRIALLEQEIEHAKRIRQELEHKHELSIKLQKEKNQMRHELMMKKQRREKMLARQRKQNFEKRERHSANLHDARARLQNARAHEAHEIYELRRKHQEQIEKNNEKLLEKKLKTKYIVTKHKAELERKREEAKLKLLADLRQQYVECVKNESVVIAKREEEISELESKEKDMYQKFLKMQKENAEFLKNSQHIRDKEYHRFANEHQRWL